MNYKLAKLGKYCLLGLFISLSLNTFSQGAPSKVKKLYDKGEYEKCIEVSKKIKSKGDNIKNPYLYIYQVLAYYKIALDEEAYNTRRPLDKALRAYATFKRKDKGGKVKEEFRDDINEFRDYTIAQAKEMIEERESMNEGFEIIIKAGELFGEDKEMRYEKAQLMMDYGDLSTKRRGMNDMINLADEIYASYKGGKKAESGMDKVFSSLATFMFSHSNRDDAQDFLDKGKEMYPNSGLLKGASFYIVDQKINLNPEISSLEQILRSKKSVEASLKEYPDDKDLLEKEDIIIDILISKYFHQGSVEGMANTMMAHVSKYPERRQQLITKYEQYLNNIINNRNYVGIKDYKRTIALEALATFNIRLNGSSTVSESAQVGYVKGMLAKQFAKKDLDSLNYYYNLAELWKPKNKTINNYMSTLNYKGIVDEIANQPQSLYNLAKLISIANTTVTNKFYKYNEADYALTYAKKLLKQKNYTDAGYIINLERRRNPNDKRFLELKKEFVIQDYLVNFLGSDIKSDEFKWNGSFDRCKPGTVDVKINEKVLQRISYVRRLAGVRDDVYFEEEYSKLCQAAALMMDVNDRLNHHPPKTWKCYTEEGEKGAGRSNLSLGHSLEDAVMGQMDDNGSNNTACGHRRWILNPNNIEFGHGSTPKAMALGVFSHVTTHNNVYDSIPALWTNNDFVAWPNPDYFIENLVPRRWSFSYSGVRFDKTEVKVEVDGKVKQVTIEPLAYGYGLNTIVWYIDGHKYEAGQVVEITISGYYKRSYSNNKEIPMSTTYKVEILPTPKGS